MHRSKIEWVLNPDNKTLGWICNPKTGCLNHTPDGLCLGGMFPCYAFRLANGRLKQRYLANKNVIPYQGEADYEQNKLNPFYPRGWPERLEKIRRLKKPTGIFLDDMSDWMGDYWPEEWTRQEFQVMRDCPQHRFYTLTKQPQNLIKWSPFPDNCWVGVTVTNDAMMIPACHGLEDIEAKTKFISFEPLIGEIDINCIRGVQFYRWLDWLIIGAQTKPYKPPRIEWIEEIESTCNKARIPVFEKDNLNPLLDYNLRQEMP